MRFASYQIDGRPGYGLVTDNGLVDLTQRLGDQLPDLAGLIAGDGLGQAEIFATADSDQSIDDVAFDLPIPRPGKIICVGVNYVDRNAEYKDGSEQPKFPSIFMRTPGSLVGHRQTIVRPPESEQLDYEGEIAMVVGKPGRRIPEAQAAEHVFGLTVMNEGSIRDWMRHGKFQRHPGQELRADRRAGPLDHDLSCRAAVRRPHGHHAGQR